MHIADALLTLAKTFKGYDVIISTAPDASAMSVSLLEMGTDVAATVYIPGTLHTPETFKESKFREELRVALANAYHQLILPNQPVATPDTPPLKLVGAHLKVDDPLDSAT